MGLLLAMFGQFGRFHKGWFNFWGPRQEHLQEHKPDQDWSSVKRTLQRWVQQWKELHSPAPEVMFPLAYQPGEIGFCDFTKVKRV